jgi:hypothetical protein
MVWRYTYWIKRHEFWVASGLFLCGAVLRAWWCMYVSFLVPLLSSFFAAWCYVHDDACVFSCSTAVIVNNPSFFFVSSNNKQWGGSNKQMSCIWMNNAIMQSWCVESVGYSNILFCWSAVVWLMKNSPLGVWIPATLPLPGVAYRFLLTDNSELWWDVGDLFHF